MMQFDTIISIYVRHDVIQNSTTCLDLFWYFYENARTKMKMQGQHKKLFLGSLRASRAIKKGLHWLSIVRVANFDAVNKKAQRQFDQMHCTHAFWGKHLLLVTTTIGIKEIPRFLFMTFGYFLSKDFGNFC